MSLPDISFVIPALDEEAAIGRVVMEARAAATRLGASCELLVLDGASRDGTVKTAEAAGARVVVETAGFAASLRRGIAEARGEWVVILDGDGSHPVDRLEALWERRAEAEVVIGSRLIANGGMAIPLYRRALTRLLNRFFRVVLSVPVADSSSGYRLYRASAVKGLEGHAQGFEFQQEILLQVLRAGGRAIEVPIYYVWREHGVSKARIIPLAFGYLRTTMAFLGRRHSAAAPAGRFARFAAGVRFNLYGQALQAALPFFTTPFILRSLGPEPYSLLILLSSLVSQLNLLGFGAAPASIKYLAELDPEREPKKVAQVFGTALLFFILTGLAGALLLLALSPLLSASVLHLTPAMRNAAGFLFVCCAATFLLQSLSCAFQSPPRALHRFDVVNAGETGAALLAQLGACALLSLGLWVRALALWQAVIAALGMLYFAAASRRLLPNISLAPHYDPEVMGRIVRFGWPMFLGQAAWSVLNQLDKVVLGFYVPMDQLVHYLIPFSLAQKLILLVGPIVPVLLPFSSQLSGAADRPNAQRLLVSGTKVTFLLLAPFTVLGCCLGPAFLELWLGGGYSEHGGWILRWLILANFASAFGIFAGMIAQGFGRFQTPALMFTALAVAVVLSWPIFVPRFGLIAAAVAYAAFQTLYATGLYWWVCRRLLDLPPRNLIAALARPLSCALPLTVACFLLRNTLRGWSGLLGFGAAAGLYWAWAAWTWGLDDSERERLLPSRP